MYKFSHLWRLAGGRYTVSYQMPCPATTCTVLYCTLLFRCALVGTLSPAHDPGYYLSCVRAVLASGSGCGEVGCFRSASASSSSSPSLSLPRQSEASVGWSSSRRMPLVVNTMGWTSGLGLMLLVDTFHLVCSALPCLPLSLSLHLHVHLYSLRTAHGFSLTPLLPNQFPLISSF